MPNPDTQITLELEGLPQEGGHLRLNDFLAQLNALKQALHSVDKAIADATDNNIYYRVVGLSHNSPAKIVLEPVSRPRNSRDVAASVQVIHDRFFQELDAISNNQPVSPDIDNQALLNFKRLVENSGKTFAKAALYNNKASVLLDTSFKDRISNLLDKEYFANGSITGRLETINLHGRKKSFRIYPEIGPKMVVCTFTLPHLKEEAKKSLEKIVTVRGRKAYRPNSNFAYRIDALEILPLKEAAQRVYLADLQGIAGPLPGNKTSVELIREVRDEWN